MLSLYLDAPRLDDLDWPVSFGIPFRQGLLRPEQQVALYDPDRQEILSRPEVVSRWPDGSVRWLLLEAVLNVKQAGRGFSLEFDSPSVPVRSMEKERGEGVKIEEQVGGISIDTGRLQAVIPHTGPGLLSRVSAAGKLILNHGGMSAAVDQHGQEHCYEDNRVVKVERDGPAHAVVLVEGDYGANEAVYRCRCRLHFYAGMPLVRLEHTIINRCGGLDNHYLRKVDLEFELTDPPGRLCLGDRKGSCLRQFNSKQYEIDRQTLAGRYSGWAQAGRRFTLGMADFWQRFPASIRLEKNTLKAGLLDDHSREGMIFAPGEAQTHDLWLWLGDEAPAAEIMMPLINQRPLLVPSATWMCESGALGNLIPYDREKHSAFERGVEAGYEEILRIRELEDEYGYRNYGDSRYHAMPRGWLNNEYDWAHAYFLQFARTGDRRYFDLAATCARHTMDTDIIHYLQAPEDHLIGAPRAHSTDHTSCGVDIGHAWLEGLFDYWSFTGDSRAHEHGRAMADFFARCVGNVKGPRYMNYPGARRPGWGLIGLTAAYESTLNDEYLKAARAIVNICAREQQSDTGAWVYPGGGLDDPRFPVGKTFMVALTLLGILRYHRLTGDSTAARILLKGVDWAIDYMWDEKAGGFRSIDTPYDTLQRGPGSSATHIMEPLIYAYRLTGDQRYQYVAAKTWHAWLEQNGKTVLKPSAIRDTFHYLPEYAEIPRYKGIFPLYSIKPAASLCVRDFCVIDDNNVWLAGLNGLMMRSQNAGRSWKSVENGGMEHLYGIDFADSNMGLAAGAGSHILRTEDGGQSWRAVDTSELRESSYHHDLKMIDGKVGYTCGCGYIWQTRNGGRSWREIWNVHNDGRWDKVAKGLSMAPLSKDRIWVVGSYGLALTIEQDGKEIIPCRGLPVSAFGIDFIDDKTGVAVCLDGSVFKTIDGGENWQIKKKPNDECLWDVGFYDRNLGYAVGQNGSVLVTRDGGDSWETRETGSRRQLRAVAVLSNQIALVAGDGGVVWRTEDQGETWRESKIDGD